jgi:hypothetical protein
MSLVPVPEEVARTAGLALATRAERGGGGTARGVVLATALSTGFVTEHEIAELADWHARNPDAIQGGVSTLLGGMYGGAGARDTWPPTPAPEVPAPVTAAAPTPIRAKFAKLNKTVNTTNQRLMVRLHTAATVALNEALRQAGVKVNVKARTKAARAALDAAGNDLRPVIAALGLTEQDLLDHRFDTFAAMAAGLIATAERKKLAAAARMLGLDPADLEAQYGETIDTRSVASAGLMVTGLTALAIGAMSGHAVTAESVQGEFSGPVPFGIVRQAFDVASRGAAVPGLSDGVGPAPIDELSQALVGAGQSIVEELLAAHADEIGPTQTRTTWVVGDPERPFEPHQALDGVSWVGDYPEELAADAGDWPYVDVYEPGDHDGCQCELTEEAEPVEGAGPLGEFMGADANALNDLVSFG